LYLNLFNVLIANGLVTCNQTVASPEYVENVVSSMKTNNVLLINQNAPTVEENTPLVVKLAPKKYILKPRDILTGSSGTLKYNLTVLEGCLSFFFLYHNM
jgi:hypothetical protein